MEAPSPQHLEKLKYSELQCLAKVVGLKANLKADKLLNALKQHFQESVQENGSMINKRGISSSEDTEELDSSQIPLDMSLVTKRRRKQKRDNVQENLEEEVLMELKESERSEGAGSGKMLNQNKYLENSGTAGNLTENSATPSQQRENCTPGKKPQFTATLSKSGRKGVVSTTPNFKKLHEAQFKKMQSIDDYIERKNSMIKKFSNSVNEVKMMAKKSNCLKTSQKETRNSNSKTRSSFRRLLLSPCPQKKSLSTNSTPVNFQRSPHNSHGTANKSITTKMNVRFSESTKDNEHKRSLTKTPSRKSPFLDACTPDNQMSNTSVTTITPFKFTARTPEPTSTKKPVFDLQASLSRPLSYQPHRGKLKPWGKSKENIHIAHSHKKNYKQPLLQTREDRREKHEQGRKQRKDKVLGTRRGLTIA
ncbi:nucleolar and spindle-associated protein 1 isoform X2 [Hemicordylus capensis]|uniref:nucleolar and spindle-associated protein 1 isoform X2 n=1 Tax=Hemicordylus capensis TaxID=884348 RepID=UPI0023048D27|nr:nucleolar and spindle-associated protein 1 isoform X2 [Hemicordylus capensis]